MQNTTGEQTLFNFNMILQCSTIGASFCYGLVSLVGRQIVIKYFPDGVDAWSKRVSLVLIYFKVKQLVPLSEVFLMFVYVKRQKSP